MADASAMEFYAASQAIFVQGQLVDPLQHQVLQQQVMGVPQLSAGMDPALQAAQMQQMGYDPAMMQASCLASYEACREDSKLKSSCRLDRIAMCPD